MKKILIVDNDPDSRMFLCNLLKTEKFKPIVAEKVSDGKAVAEIQKPDAIVINMMMGGKNEFIFFQKLKKNEKLKKTPVILLSGIDKKTLFLYQKMHWKLDECVFDPDAFLEIPYDARELLETLDHLTGKSMVEDRNSESVGGE